jgi:hypothetical protein
MSLISSRTSDTFDEVAADADRRFVPPDDTADNRLAESPDSFVESPSDEYSKYRALSPAAIVSSVVGLGSLVAFIDWWLVVVPLCGLTLGVVALRQIASRPAELTGRVPAMLGIALSIAFLVAGQSRLWYIRLTEVPDGHIRMSYDDLQPDPRVVNEVVPLSVEEFHGKRVFVKGYVLAGTRKDGIRTFILVRDKGDCCFGGNPKLTDRILVQLKPGRSFSYTDRLQKLAGLFHVRPGQAVDVSGAVVYQLDDAEIL